MMSIPKRTIILYIWVILMNNLQCFCSSAFSASKQEDCVILTSSYNVIIISIDTLRADHLGCYGYSRNTSPNIDKLAKESILFEQAISQAGSSLASHAALFTSQYVSSLGLNDATREMLPSRVLTLAEILRENGYETAAFTGGGLLNHRFGLNQGFDIYYDGEVNSSGFGSFRHIMPRAIEWLEENKKNKFFLFLHSYDVHEPFYSATKYKNMFDPDYKGIMNHLSFDFGTLTRIIGGYIHFPKEKKIIKLSAGDKAHIIARYDSCIRYADDYIGLFLRNIDSLGLMGRTIIVILSDHGEELFDHGFVLRHGGFYDEMIHVPLVIYHSSIEGNKKIKQQVQLIDVMPTILDLLDIDYSCEKLQGVSLLPLIKNNGASTQDRDAYTGGNVIRTKKWKYISRYALFDLENDAKELKNLISDRPFIALELDEKLRNWKDQNSLLYEALKSNRKISIDAVNKEKLKRMGYWQ